MHSLYLISEMQGDKNVIDLIVIKGQNCPTVDQRNSSLKSQFRPSQNSISLFQQEGLSIIN